MDKFEEANKQEIEFLKEFTSLAKGMNLNNSICIQWKEFVRIMYYYKLRVTCKHQNTIPANEFNEGEFCLDCGYTNTTNNLVTTENIEKTK